MNLERVLKPENGVFLIGPVSKKVHKVTQTTNQKRFQPEKTEIYLINASIN